MLLSKFDLYKSEWLDLVFADRNKDYGAYELRQQYDRTMANSLGLTFLSIGVLSLIGMAFSHPKVVVHPADKDRVITEVTLHHHVDPPAPPRKARQQPKPSAPVKTTALPPLVVKPDPEIKAQAPDVTKIQGAIGPVTIDGPAGPPNALPDTKAGSGTGNAPGPDNTVYPPVGLEFMPTPFGGEAAWNKFLSKNLRFPQEAQDASVSGRVYVSFIVEKDGSLSNITVERGAGYGFDDEATRVLRLAKPWKPGRQNGQPVRVKFVIPVNFQFSGE